MNPETIRPQNSEKQTEKPAEIQPTVTVSSPQLSASSQSLGLQNQTTAPVQGIQPIQQKPSKVRGMIILGAFTLLIIVIAVSGFLALSHELTHQKVNNQPTVSGGTVLPILSNAEQTRVNEGLPPNPSSQPLSIVNTTGVPPNNSLSRSNNIDQSQNGISSVGYSPTHNYSYSINNSSFASETITSSKNDPNYVNPQGSCATDNASNTDNGCGPYNNVTFSQPYIVSGYDNYVDFSQFLLDKKVVYTTPTVKSVSYFHDSDSSSKTSTLLKPVGSNNTLNGTDNYGGLVCTGVNNNGDFYFAQDLGVGKLQFIIDSRYAYVLNKSDFQFNLDSQCFVNDTDTHYVIYTDQGYLDVDGKVTYIGGSNDIQSVELNGNTLYIYKF